MTNKYQTPAPGDETALPEPCPLQTLPSLYEARMMLHASKLDTIFDHLAEQAGKRRGAESVALYGAAFKAQKLCAEMTASLMQIEKARQKAYRKP